MNDLGTLITARSTTSGKSIICEINRETKELNIYEVDYAIYDRVIINYMICTSNRLFFWDIETHSLIVSTNTVSNAGWYEYPNTITYYIENNTITAICLLPYNSSNIIRKHTLNLTSGEATVTSFTIRSGSNTPHFSVDKRFILCYDNTNLYVYSFDIYNLNTSLLYTIALSTINSSTLNDFCLISLDNNILMLNNNFYDVTDWNNITLITTFDNSYAGNIYQWDTPIKQFIANISYVSYIVGFPNDSTAHYFIQPYSGVLDDDKIYGITSKAMLFGETGNAQMLFSSYPPVT